MNAMPTRIPTQAEYERNEQAQFIADLRRVDAKWRRASPAERREDEQQFLDALRDPALIAERIGWLIDGNYGYGSYRAALEVLLRPRMNREAWFTQIIGALEWRIPQDVVVRIWRKLSPAEKRKLEAAVKKVVNAPEALEIARGFAK